MATFPSLRPSSRTYTPGEYPHTSFRALSGVQNNVRHSNVVLNARLTLVFTGITETQMLSIVSHYQGQFGSFDSFDLSADTWIGTTSSDFTLSGYVWRYAAAPNIKDRQASRHDVSVELEAYPPERIIQDGKNLIVMPTLTAGVAAAASGIQQSVTTTASGSAAAAEGSPSPVTISLDAGSASG